MSDEVDDWAQNKLYARLVKIRHPNGEWLAHIWLLRYEKNAHN